MGSRFLRLRWSCFFLQLCVVVGCSSILEVKRPEGDKFLHEISRLERLAREDPTTSVRAKSHLKLAFLYVDSRNPQLNYSQALQEMESYLALSPAKDHKDDFQNWLAALREMDHLRKHRIEIEKKNQSLHSQIEKSQANLEKKRIEMKKQNQNLQAEIDKSQVDLEKVRKANSYLRGEVATLKETNNRLLEIIERLKILDWQIEERRSLMK